MKRLFLAFLFLTGCATAQKINRVGLGMTKNDVIQIMGRPISVSATDGVEYLNYRLSETFKDRFHDQETPYFIRLRNGKVDAYGRHGDFDSTKDPSLDLNIRNNR